MKNLFKLIVILVFQQSIGQVDTLQFGSAVKDLSSEEFTTAVNDFKQITESQIYIDYKKSLIELTRKMPKGLNSEIMSDDKLFSEWIKAKISLSKFKNAEEAISLRKRSMELNSKIISDNLRVYKLIGRATREQLHVILKPDTEEGKL